jgi:DNA ligase D-like protein (predicted ligase)
MALTLVPPMMATPAAALPVGERWSYEVKWDGYRALLVMEREGAKLLSRNLKNLTADYPHIAAAAHRVTRQPAMLDGEIVALDERGLPSFQALQHRTAKRSAVVFYAFDVLYLGETDYLRRPLRERRAALDRLTFSAPILRSEPLDGTAERVEAVVRKAGLEGVVAKRVDSVYEPGKRTDTWLKVKFQKRQELVIGGYKPAGNSFDSVLVGFYERRKFLYAGKVRAGFRSQTRAEVWERIAPLGLSTCPFDNLPNSTGKSHWGEGITAEDMKALRWVKPAVVIEVAYTEFTAGGNLRHALFVGLRNDKHARDVRRRA